MKLDFSEKKILITGGTRGIGYEIARQYKQLGATVVVTGTTTQRPKELDAELLYEELLICSSSNWKQRLDEIITQHIHFDICINNAGINKVNYLPNTQSDDIDDILLINLNAPLYISSQVSKSMIKKKSGAIINIASIFGVVTKPGRNPYTASKSGLIGVTKTMAVDLGAYNILVNAISPGFVDTELTRKVLGEDGMKEMAQKVPLNRLATVSDIAPAVLFLTSSLNTYITGQNIIIDGGFTCE